MKATLKNYRQSPRKVRLLADLVRGKSVAEALTILRFTGKRAAEPFAKLIESARANAVAAGKKGDRLVVKAAAVDKGEVYQRFMPRARGSASPINRRNSHIAIILEERSQTAGGKGQNVKAQGKSKK
jgi:large subunit ribosomal protein L22